MNQWEKHLLGPEDRQHLIKIIEALQRLSEQELCLPSPETLFRSLDLVPEPRMIILGQDPYPNPNHACGLAFAVPKGTSPLPGSLRNIFKELTTDVGEFTTDCSLEPWVRQGVLLLNSCLSVAAGKPGSHRCLGWERITDKIITEISRQYEHRVFVLWGNFAQAKKSYIDPEKHLILESVHPSPLSATRGFFGSKPFSKTNQYLERHQLDPIHW